MLISMLIAGRSWSWQKCWRRTTNINLFHDMCHGQNMVYRLWSSTPYLEFLYIIWLYNSLWKSIDGFFYSWRSPAFRSFVTVWPGPQLAPGFTLGFGRAGCQGKEGGHIPMVGGLPMDFWLGGWYPIKYLGKYKRYWYWRSFFPLFMVFFFRI